MQAEDFRNPSVLASGGVIAKAGRSEGEVLWYPTLAYARMGHPAPSIQAEGFQNPSVLRSQFCAPGTMTDARRPNDMG